MPDTATRRAVAHARIAQIAVQFLERTREELQDVDGLVMRAVGGDDTARAVLRQLAHRINGAGATLGFPDISRCAAALEQLLRGAEPPDAGALACAASALRASLEGR